MFQARLCILMGHARHDNRRKNDIVIQEPQIKPKFDLMIISCTFVDVKVQPIQLLLKVRFDVNNEWVWTFCDAIPVHFGL